MQFTLGKRIPKMGDEGLRNTCVRDRLSKKFMESLKKCGVTTYFYLYKKKKEKEEDKLSI